MKSISEQQNLFTIGALRGCTDIETTMRDTGRMSKTEGPGSREWPPGPRDVTYTGLEYTGRAIVGAMVNRGIPGGNIGIAIQVAFSHRNKVVLDGKRGSSSPGNG